MSGTSKATIAGILDITAGISALIGSFVLGAIGVISGGVISTVAEPEVQGAAAIPLVIFLPLAALCLVAGAVAVIGGIAALKRGSWWLTVAGGVAALLCLPPLGVAAIVFTVLAEPEFADR